MSSRGESEVQGKGRQAGKNRNPAYRKATIYLPEALHRKLKAACAEEDTDMTVLVQGLVEEWLKAREGKQQNLSSAFSSPSGLLVIWF